MTKQHLWVWGSLLLACVAYFLPWIWNPAAVLSPNAYDLAEWTTLHPVVRNASPALLPSFLLRAVLGILAMLIALQSSLLPNGRWIGRLVALGLVIVMLPPADYFITARGDVNYRQQFLLSGFTFLGVIGEISIANRLSSRAKSILSLLLVVLGIGAGVWGCASAVSTYAAAFGVDVWIGGGGILYCVMLLVFATGVVLDSFRTTKNQE